MKEPKDVDGRLGIDDDGLMVIFVKLMLISLYAYFLIIIMNICYVKCGYCGENGDRRMNRMIAYLMTRTSFGSAEYFPLYFSNNSVRACTYLS